MKTETTRQMMRAAQNLSGRGIAINGLEVKTDDGRLWVISAVPTGHGRRTDGSWGGIVGRGGGYRLFEVDPNDRERIEEHDSTDGDTWFVEDIGDYLRAVGGRRTTNQDKVADAE